MSIQRELDKYLYDLYGPPRVDFLEAVESTRAYLETSKEKTMTPGIYKKKQNDPKRVLLELSEGEGGPVLRAMAEDGHLICLILSFLEGGVAVHGGAKHLLEGAGYDTSWARWGEHGHFSLS